MVNWVTIYEKFASLDKSFHARYMDMFNLSHGLNLKVKQLTPKNMKNKTSAEHFDDFFLIEIFSSSSNLS